MASWKKVIVSGSQAHLAGITGSALTDNRIVFTSTSGALSTDDILQYVPLSGSATGEMVLSGSIFSGSFVGDGSGLTGVTPVLNLTASDGNSNTSGSIDLSIQDLLLSGSNGIEIEVSGNTIHFHLSESVEDLIIDDLVVLNSSILSGSVTAAYASGSPGPLVWDLTQVDAVSGSKFSGSFAGDGSELTGVTPLLNITASNSHGVSGSNGSSGSIDLSVQDLIFSGSNGINLEVSGNIINIHNTGEIDDLTVKNLTVLESTVLSGSTEVTGTLDIAGPTNITGDLGVVGDSTFDGGTVFTGSASGSTTTVTINGDSVLNGSTTLNGGTTVISGSLYGSASGSFWDVTGVPVISGSIFSGSFVGDGSGLTGLVTTLKISGSSAVSGSAPFSGSIDLLEDVLIVSGTANEVEVTFDDASNTLQVGLPDDVVVTNNLTVGGDLIVNGDTTVLETQNLLIEDRWALFASGSTLPVDGGILVQNNSGSQAYALGVDSSETRWALQKDMTDGTNDIVADSWMTTTQFGLEAAQPGSPMYGSGSAGYGNMWVSTDTEDIYIWS